MVEVTPRNIGFLLAGEPNYGVPASIRILGEPLVRRRLQQAMRIFEDFDRLPILSPNMLSLNDTLPIGADPETLPYNDIRSIVKVMVRSIDSTSTMICPGLDRPIGVVPSIDRPLVVPAIPSSIPKPLKLIRRWALVEPSRELVASLANELLRRGIVT